MLPSTKRRKLVLELSDICAQFDLSLDELLDELAESITIDARDEDDAMVRSAIMSAAEHLRHASMDLYVSTK